jgi:CRISPR-associated protein (TIGR02710 family)
MKRALIITVGTSTNGADDITVRLAEDIRLCAPTHIVFVVTDLSKSTAMRIIEALALTPEHYEFLKLDSPHDLQEIFHKVNDTIRQLVEKGYPPENISVNYTSGTKVMSSGAVISAVFNACETLRYIFSSPQKGVSSRVITTSPRAIFAYRDIMLARTLCLEMRFSAAADILHAVDESLLGGAEMSLLANLRLVARAYHHWDNFHYGEFLKIYPEVQFELQELEEFRLSSDQLPRITALADDVQQGSITPLVLVDLYNNALRRQLERKYDDALARLYRAAEMLAQWVLRRDYDIASDDLDTRKVPPKYRESYNVLRSMEDGKVKMGLRKSYELLALLGAQIGMLFQDNSDLQKLIEQRRRLMLAHGVTAGSETICVSFMSFVRELLAGEVPEIDELQALLQFPWLLKGNTVHSNLTRQPEGL